MICNLTMIDSDCVCGPPTPLWTNWSMTSTPPSTRPPAVEVPGLKKSRDHLKIIPRSGVSRRKAWKRRCKSTSNLVMIITDNKS